MNRKWLLYVAVFAAVWILLSILDHQGPLALFLGMAGMVVITLIDDFKMKK